MKSEYITRAIEPVIKKAAAEFPAVVLTGPRQSGKTTVLKRMFSESCRYVSLELPDVRQAALEDPRGFLAQYSPPVIFDEIHYAADLLPYIKERIDEKRDEPGQYIMTGSQNLMIMEKVTETLAGRTAVLKLLPLSRREIEGTGQTCFPWEQGFEADSRTEPICFGRLWDMFLRGFYPEINVHTERDTGLWFSSYIQTYLERDVRTLRQVGDLIQFQTFVRALAARSAQLLNMTELARDLGIAVNTVKQWISILEATHQVIILRPYFANTGKRLVKTPKVYFTDTGLLCHLTGNKDAEQAAKGPMGGYVMETAVIIEIVKTIVHRGEEPRVYFWRTAAGNEVDFIIESGQKAVPVEVKLSATVKPAMSSSIRVFKKDLSGRASEGYVVHPGNTSLPLGEGVFSIPFGNL